MDGSDVRRAAAAGVDALTPNTGRDWREITAGGLTWSCWTTAAHIAHDLVAYAGQVAAQPDDAYLPYDLSIHDSATPSAVLAVIRAAAGILASTVDTASSQARAWHWGSCDPGGFAAMGVAEILLHTVDITRGLAVPWSPPVDLCGAVLARLFPDAPPGDPAAVLLWCTGRGDLPGRDRLTHWVWKAAL
jgi:hypothetical protein